METELFKTSEPGEHITSWTHCEKLQKYTVRNLWELPKQSRYKRSYLFLQLHTANKNNMFDKSQVFLKQINSKKPRCDSEK